MTQDAGHWRGVQTLDEVQVAVANARRARTYQYFSGGRLVDLHVLDDYRLIDLAQNCCFHLNPLGWRLFQVL